jgi:diguanylate cyclase (GGDEF)-like protein/PAS domain S-box-containing protein
MSSKENEALQKTSSIFSKIFSLANDAVFLVDKKGKITLWNAAAEKMFGYTSAEMMGEEIENFFSYSAGENNPIKNIGILSGELKDNIVPFSFTIKNGLKIFIEASFSVIEGIDEYRMMVVVRNISHLMKIKDELHNEKMKFINAFENAPFGIILINKNGEFEYINNKFRELFGYTIDELPDGKTWFRKAFPNPEYRHEIILTWLNSSIDEKSGKKDSRILTVTCKDKTEKIINFIPVRINEGEFVVSCEDMTELKKSEYKLLRFANYDMLTGLPNRRSLELALRITIDKAKKSERRGNLSALLFLDIDDFKEINHSFGHNTGDEVLIAVGKLLSKSLRTGDSAFRFEGDEFAILFRGISMAEARLAAERLQNIINQHNFVFDYTKNNLTIGIGLIQINGKIDFATLLSLVVRTTHKAKALGRNCIAVY